MPGVRARAPRLHRWMGRVFILSGLLSGLTIYWLSLTPPAMGGLLTVVGTWAFTTWMIAALVIAYLAIRRRDVARHRAFMIRAYAIGAGVATIRLLGILGEVGLGIDFVANFGLWLWAGMTLHVLGAELILRRRIVFGRRATA